MSRADVADWSAVPHRPIGPMPSRHPTGLSDRAAFDDRPSGKGERPLEILEVSRFHTASVWLLPFVLGLPSAGSSTKAPEALVAVMDRSTLELDVRRPRSRGSWLRVGGHSRESPCHLVRMTPERRHPRVVNSRNRPKVHCHADGNRTLALRFQCARRVRVDEWKDDRPVAADTARRHEPTDPSSAQALAARPNQRQSGDPRRRLLQHAPQPHGRVFHLLAPHKPPGPA